MKKIFSLFVSLVCTTLLFSQGFVPSVNSNFYSDDKGRLYIKDSARSFYLTETPATYTLQKMMGAPKGDDRGIVFYFGDNKLNGLLYYGFIAYGDSRHPQPVYFKETAEIKDGMARIIIKEKLAGKYDMVGWEKSGKGTLGYRVVTTEGHLLYDGRVSFTGKGPFKVVPTLTEGPFVHQVTHNSAIISFDVSTELQATVEIGGKVFTGSKAMHHHEIAIKGLAPDSIYTYTVIYGDNRETYALTTAPKPGSRKYFIFSYASDSRNGNGGGERDIYGTNAFIMERIMALNSHKGVSFTQFTGDLIDGYLTHKEEINLQYANWKRAIEPYAHYIPVYVGMGNHEALVHTFAEEGKAQAGRISVDKFPYATESAEAVFAANFVNPQNGPTSEDGSTYDPNPAAQDFPPYAENVYYYTYDNVGMIVLNSDYWYAPSTEFAPVSSGNVHGYIMDKQMEWLEKTLQILEADTAIDHVFVTVHTPFFPNGGHVKDDMWYNGNNNVKPYIKGTPVALGIIQRRDQLLNLLVNKSTKTLALLTGDEHNYCKTRVGPATPRYPEGWTMAQFQLNRTLYQINNGAAGAPYYAQEQAPWTSFTTGFTTQNAVVYFHVNGKSVEVEVVNPVTLEEIENYVLR